MVAAEEVDHIVPRRHGGTDDESNLQSRAFVSRTTRPRPRARFGGVGESILYGRRFARVLAAKRRRSRNWNFPLLKRNERPTPQA